MAENPTNNNGVAMNGTTREGAYVQGADIYTIYQRQNTTTFSQSWILTQLGRMPEGLDGKSDQEVIQAVQAAWRQLERDARTDAALQQDLGNVYQGVMASGGRLQEGTSIRLGRGSITPGAFDADGAINLTELTNTVTAWQIVNNDYTEREFNAYKQDLQNRINSVSRVPAAQRTPEQTRELQSATRARDIWRGVSYDEYLAGERTNGTDLPNKAHGGGGLLDVTGGCGFNPVIFKDGTQMMPPGDDAPVVLGMDCRNGVCTPRPTPVAPTPTVTLDEVTTAEIEDIQYRTLYTPIFDQESGLDLNGLSPSVNRDELAAARARDRGGMAHAGNWYLGPPERPPARSGQVRDQRSEGIRAGGGTDIQSLVGMPNRDESVAYPTTTPQGRGQAPEAYVYSQFTDYLSGNEGNANHLGVLANLTRVVRGPDGEVYVQGDNGLKPISVEAWEGRNNLTTDTPSAFTQLTRTDLFRTAEGIDHFSHLVVTAEAEQVVARSLPPEMLVEQGGQQVINWPAIAGGTVRITRELTPAEAQAVQNLQGLEYQTMFNVASYGDYPGIISAQERAGRMRALAGVFEGNTTQTEFTNPYTNQPILVGEAMNNFVQPTLNLDDWNPNAVIAAYQANGGQLPDGLANPYNFVVWDRAYQPQVRDALDVDDMRIPREISRGGDAALEAARVNAAQILGVDPSTLTIPSTLVEGIRAGGDRAKDNYRQFVAVELLRPEGRANWERIVTRGGLQSEMEAAQGRYSYARTGQEFQAMGADSTPETRRDGAGTLRFDTPEAANGLGPRELMAVASGQYAQDQTQRDRLTVDMLQFFSQQEGGNERGWGRSFDRFTQDEGTDQHLTLGGYAHDRDADADMGFLEDYLAGAPGQEGNRDRWNGHLSYQGTPLGSRIVQILTIGLYTPGATNNMDDVQDELIAPAITARINQIDAKLDSGETLSADDRRFLGIYQRAWSQAATAQYPDAAVAFTTAFEPRRNEREGLLGSETGDAVYDPDYLAITRRLAEVSGGRLDEAAIREIGRESAGNTHDFTDAEIQAERGALRAGPTATFVGQAPESELDRGIEGEAARVAAIRGGALQPGGTSAYTASPTTTPTTVDVATMFPTGEGRPANAARILSSVTADNSAGLAMHALRVLARNDTTQAPLTESILALDLSTVTGLPEGFTGRVDTLRAAYAARETNPTAYTRALNAVMGDFGPRSQMPEAITDQILTGVANGSAATTAYDVVFSSTVRTANNGELGFGEAFMRNMNTDAERRAVSGAVFNTQDPAMLRALAEYQRTLGAVSSVNTVTRTVVPVAVGQQGPWTALQTSAFTTAPDGSLRVADYGLLANQINTLRTADAPNRITQGETNVALLSSTARTSPAIVGLTLLQILAAERAQGLTNGPTSQLIEQMDDGGRGGSQFAHLLTSQADRIIAAGNDTQAIAGIYQETMTALNTPEAMSAYAALTQALSQEPLVAAQYQGMLTGLIANNGEGLQRLLTSLEPDAQQAVLTNIQSMLTGQNSEALGGYLTGLAVSEQAGLFTNRGVSQTDIIILIAGIIGFTRGHGSTPGTSDPVIDPTKPVTLPPLDPTMGGGTVVIPPIPPLPPVGGGFATSTATGWSWNGAPMAGAAVGGAILNGADGGDGRDRDAEVDGFVIPPVLGAAVLRTGDGRDDEEPAPPSGSRRPGGPPNR